MNSPIQVDKVSKAKSRKLSLSRSQAAARYGASAPVTSHLSMLLLLLLIRLILLIVLSIFMAKA